MNEQMNGQYNNRKENRKIITESHLNEGNLHDNTVWKTDRVTSALYIDCDKFFNGRAFVCCISTVCREREAIECMICIIIQQIQFSKQRKTIW